MVCNVQHSVGKTPFVVEPGQDVHQPRAGNAGLTGIDDGRMWVMASLLQPGGSLLVTELCSHNQSWAREACGDLWLGFEQDDLARWATAAGLVPGESLYVGLRNGFQIQVRHFQRPAGDTHHR